ncbi:MAG: NAD(P)(+) transhydrogenase (Re/Si-specific) subunit beta [Ruminococcaceae bacterium]|nr:NAD(P)(+) transhydrogenase (Re/Si-specific) subunit beta [Oscillospiraceae bacterium]
MSNFAYYIVCAALTLIVLTGIYLMSKVKTALFGNLLGAGALMLAVAITIIRNPGNLSIVLICLLAASIFGLIWSSKVKMIEMPETVALLNGIGGLASAIIGGIEFLTCTGEAFSLATAMLAVVIGTITFTGSLIAAGKLSKKIDSAPRSFKGHLTVSIILVSLMILSIVFPTIGKFSYTALFIGIVASAIFGTLFAFAVGGADMPITISLLNSLSGVAGSIAGMAVYNILLVAIGGIVGASGLLLTQIMCRSMNRSLADILLGKTTVSNSESSVPEHVTKIENSEKFDKNNSTEVLMTIRDAKNIIIVPGYGMALSQAQFLIKELYDVLTSSKVTVRFAIHPVAGRMPGHMNVLLCEADIDYEDLYELDDINEDFEKCDLAIVIGANDVINPAARDATDTPIYGMPILNVDLAKNIIICNYDLKPGYAGVENPIYSRPSGVSILLGDAKESITKLIDILKNPES